MSRKIRKILAGLLVLTLCVPANTAFAERTGEYVKEEQNTLLQDELESTDDSGDKEIPQDAAGLEENNGDSGNEEIPEEPEVPEPEVPAPEWETGWNFYEGNWYYAQSENTLYFGWIKLKSQWYYLDGEQSGIMACDEVKKIGDHYYVFDANGAMQIGWVLRSEGWYYAESSGACAIGWRKLKNKWYYLDENDTEYPTRMLDNCTKNIAGKNYYFAVGGAMLTGWVHRPEGWYYADSNGAQASGWRKVRGVWYYMDPTDNNRMVDYGWKEINNAWYFLNNSGAMAFNWLALNGNWYWLGSDGAMKTGWQVAGGIWYYMYTKGDVHGGSEGVMAKNTVIDGYVVHENGAYIRSRNKLGWQNPSGYPQVSSLTVKLPSYCTGYFTYVTPSRISIYATRQECVNTFIARAYEYLGTRYIEPWSSYPGDAVDCSGFVLQCLYATGMDLGIYNPYNHRWMASQTYNSMNWYNNRTFMPVSTNAIQRGDLVYYRGHVAIYLGNGQIIDSWPGQGVSVKPIGSRGKVIGAARPYV